MRQSSSVWRDASRSSSAPRSPCVMTMTKADIVERIYEKVGFSKKEATEVVESIFELVKRRLERGEKVKISGFGNFVVNEKRPRKGRNPQTGEEIVISGRRVREGARTSGTRRVRAGGATLAEVRQELLDL